MNIFYLNESPRICAQEHCDKHVVKMIIEYAQILSTAHRFIDGVEFEGRTKTGRRARRWRHPDQYMEDTLYKVTHLNHPSTQWTLQSADHYEWLHELWVELSAEYTYRYNREHLTYTKLKDVLSVTPKNIKQLGFTQPPPAMQAFKECIVPGDSIKSYKNYYNIAKSDFATWKVRSQPEWYNGKDANTRSDQPDQVRG